MDTQQVQQVQQVGQWPDVLSASFQDLFSGVILYSPKIIIAVVIFVIGWLIGVGVGRVVKQVVDALRVDHALRSTGIEQVLSRAGFQLSAGKFFGFLVEWFFIVAFLVASLQVLELTQVNIFLTTVLEYIPNVIAAALILLTGAMLADAAERVVSGSARAAALTSAGLTGKVARYAIWVFAILGALAQLKVGEDLVGFLFQGLVISVSLAVGLAFGLGGQASAAHYLEHLRSQLKD